LKRLLELGDFLRRIYLQRRFAELSPLQLLHVEITGSLAACDWLMRSKCRWDEHEHLAERTRNASLEAIRDALAVRDLFFAALPEVNFVTLQVYRRNKEDALELVITGTVQKREGVNRLIRSVVMQAKLCGLKFLFGDRGLEALPTDGRQKELVEDFVVRSEALTNGGSSNAS